MLAATATLAACDQYVASDDPPSDGGASSTEVASPGPAVAASTCGTPDELPRTVTVEALRRIDGSCVGGADAVVFRCDPALDPVAVLGAGGPEPAAFVGGSFAVPVEEIPARAAAIGFGATGRYYRHQDDPALLFVQAGGVLERWLALPRPGAVAAPPTALLVGDSILDGSATALATPLAAWDLTVDAEIGRTSVGGIAVVESAAASPDVAVIELGTNDLSASTFRANADRILAAPAVLDADLVVWVTARTPDGLSAAVNREIVAAASSLPHATVADWDDAARAEDLADDGVHLVPGDEDVFAGFLAGVLEDWRAAVHARGPARCRNAVVGTFVPVA